MKEQQADGKLIEMTLEINEVLTITSLCSTFPGSPYRAKRAKRGQLRIVKIAIRLTAFQYLHRDVEIDDVEC